MGELSKSGFRINCCENFKVVLRRKSLFSYRRRLNSKRWKLEKKGGNFGDREGRGGGLRREREVRWGEREGVCVWERGRRGRDERYPPLLTSSPTDLFPFPLPYDRRVRWWAPLRASLRCAAGRVGQQTCMKRALETASACKGDREWG